MLVWNGQVNDSLVKMQSMRCRDVKVGFASIAIAIKVLLHRHCQVVCAA